MKPRGELSVSTWSAPSRTVLSIGLILASSSSACATLLDFQDARDKQGLAAATDLAEAGATASSEDASASSTANSPRADAGGQDAFDAGAGAGSGTGTASNATACTPAPPREWTGPLAIFEASSGAPVTAPSCGGAYATRYYDGSASLVAAPATCDCACDAPADVACSAPELAFYADPTCRVLAAAKESLAATPSCTIIDVSSANAARFSIGASTPIGGGCAPRASQVLSPPTWGSSGRLCAGSSASVSTAPCAAGEIAVPQTGAPFEPGNHCVARPGDWTCPAGYPAARTYYRSAVDGRGCTACSCGAPAGASCGATTFTDDNCSLGAKSQTSAGTCERQGSVRSASFSDTATGGKCAPQGGAPTGTVAPAGPMTICCTE
jgi:hypothetical protein